MNNDLPRTFDTPKVSDIMKSIDALFDKHCGQGGKKAEEVKTNNRHGLSKERVRQLMGNQDAVLKGVGAVVHKREPVAPIKTKRKYRKGFGLLLSGMAINDTIVIQVDQRSAAWLWASKNGKRFKAKANQHALKMLDLTRIS